MKYLLAFGLLCLIFPSFGGVAIHKIEDVTSKVVTGQNADQFAHWADQQGQKAVASSKSGGKVVPQGTTTATTTTTVTTPEQPAVQTAGQAATPLSPTKVHLSRSAATVASVLSGDSLRLTDGSVVKLAQVQSPRASRCYGARAARALAGLAHPGDRVLVAADPALPGRDQQGRLIRYVWDGSIFLNARTLVVGATAPRFERELRGEYATRFERYGHQARSSQVGLWGDCHAAYDPYRDVATGPAQ
jgi:endonuclease YncB( thermonuclease family)